MKEFQRKRILLDYIADADSSKSLIAKRPTWDEYFMILAKMAATRSTCISRPTGAVIVKNKQVLSTGYNGSMPGIAHCTDEGACFRRSSGAGDAGKYDNCRSAHAEANALAQAAKNGINVDGATAYVTLYPCYVCTKLLVQSGIKKVFYEYEYKSTDSKRDKLWEEALKQAGLEIGKVKLSDTAVFKTMVSLLSSTSWRRELLVTGEPTGRIENIHMEELHK
jgi:dCMP deaminase